MDFKWMAWTKATAWFFTGIGVLIIAMTLWELRRPSLPRKGFLPMLTTRGDRLFLILMGSALIHMVFFLFTAVTFPWTLGACGAYALAVAKWG